MERKLITPDPSAFPEAFRPLLKGEIYDSSCSREARVLYIPRENCFLKSAPKGSLKREGELTAFFHGVYKAPEVLCYLSEERDWLLTTAVEGEDCTHPDHLAEPKKLCELWAETLRTIHSLPTAGCPVEDHGKRYFATAEENYRKKAYDLTYCGGAFATAEEAYGFLEARRRLPEKNTLLHGDYCLPNVMLKGWQVSGLIDLGNGGVGDRHVDLYWGAWTLEFNLHTDAYRDRFFDAYGRDLIDEERLLLVSAAEVFG
jgi:kanamycin kinase